MKYTTIYATLGALLALGSAHAATISITDATLSSGTSDLGGAVLISTTITDNNSSSGTVTYTISNLDIDGSGGTNDIVKITFNVTGGDSSGAANLRTNGSGSYLSAGGVNLDADGDFVNIQSSTVTVDLNGIADSGSGIFAGFTGGSLSKGNGEDGTVNGIFVEGPADDYDLTPGGNDAILDVKYETSVGATGTWRANGWAFQIEASAVPEPSSTALLGLGGLALIFRRRK